MASATDFNHLTTMPGPCSMCGATNYPQSFGGPSICPACDCGIRTPGEGKMMLENIQLRAEVDRLESQWTHMQDVARAAGFEGCTDAIVKAEQLKVENAALKTERDDAIDDYKRIHGDKIDLYEGQIALKSRIDRLAAALRELIAVWDRQCGRVFEAMGSENPRAQAIDESVESARAALNPPEAKG